jgi:hypothetical protein
MAAPTEPGGAGRALGRDPRRPSQLLVWTPAEWSAAARAEPWSDGNDGESGFELAEWVQRRREDEGLEVVAAVFPNHLGERGGELDSEALTRTAIGLADQPDDRRVFTGDTLPTSLRALRRWATEQLQGSPYPTEDVVLVLSELSTNVERHAGGWLTVDLVETQGVLVVAVTDPQLQRLPTLRDVGPDELTGRGLMVVATLAELWGVVVRPGSKTVWAAIAPTGTKVGS